MNSKFFSKTSSRPCSYQPLDQAFKVKLCLETCRQNMVLNENHETILRRLFAMKAPKAHLFQWTFTLDLVSKTWLYNVYRIEFAPWKVLITLVILIAFLEPMEPTSPQYQVLDFFAGAGRIANAAKAMGESTAAFDIGYHSNPRVFDMNSAPGFVFLGSIRIIWYRYTVYILLWFSYLCHGMFMNFPFFHFQPDHLV